MNKAISELNEYCQKHQTEYPNYMFATNANGNWSCRVTLNGIDGTLTTTSAFYSNKKQAKEMAAAALVSLLPCQTQAKIIISDDYCFLIDGDQRMDCWNFLINEVEDSDKLDSTVFISPVTPVPKGNRFKLFISKTTSRDSADANMLMSMGDHYYNDFIDRPECLVIVSSDHILVQAAIDFGFTCIPHLASLKQWIQNHDEFKPLVC